LTFIPSAFSAGFHFSEHPDSHRDGSDGYRVTKVSISIKNESLARLEKIIDGFKIGFTACLQQLDKLLLTLKDK